MNKTWVDGGGDVFHTASGVALVHETVEGLNACTLLPSGSGPPALLCSWDHTHTSP